MKVISAHSPKWADTKQTVIDMMVTFEGLGEVPFTARPDDKEYHGWDLFVRAKRKEFGDIAPYEGPTDEEIARQVAAQQQSKQIAANEAALAKLMAAVNQEISPLSDAAEYGVASESELERLRALKMYRIELMRVKDDPGWPSNVTLPTAPI